MGAPKSVYWALVGATALAAVSACSGSSNDERGAGGSSGNGAGGASAASATGGSSSGTGGASTGGNSAAGGSSSGTGGASTGGDGMTGGASGAAGSGGGGGSGGAADCPSGCPNGKCWLGLDGTSTCVSPPTDPPRETCDSTFMMCCTVDSECTDGDGGRCVSNISQYFGCGGARPFGNSCYYDACTSDDDCPAVDGASVEVCVPPGALGNVVSKCVSGGCRTHADCTTHPDGQCLFGEARTHGTCDRRQIFYCAYPSDPCQDRNTACSGVALCLPNENYDGRSCGPPPPMYP